ncbi:MAG: DUF4965 domain-containing protein, partial [Clostridia bacterium]
MMSQTRLPALPLVVNDPYFSIWCAADCLTDADTTHWAGDEKPVRGVLTIDGEAYRFLGVGDFPAMETVAQTVTPTATYVTARAAGVQLEIRFTTPLLLSDWDTLSTPITMVDFAAQSIDGQAHTISLALHATDALCYNGAERPDMMADAYRLGTLSVAYTGQRGQKVLCHSGDHITIDWGYLYLASPSPVCPETQGLAMHWQTKLMAEERRTTYVLLGYDDIASIQYFGTPTKAWYARGGQTFPEALSRFAARHDALLQQCEAFDAQLLADARAMGGEDYALIVAAAYRQTIGAHKLIADAQGKPVLLSKENDSNGCAGTVDVSYPSTPLFLRYAPELVRAMCRPVLHFAMLPVWPFDFAPHDVGRYPQATGQVYGVNRRAECEGDSGNVYPPYYLYPAGTDCYRLADQMPVEECGNMLVMLAAAAAQDGDLSLVRTYRPLLAKWVEYLMIYGE